MDLDLSRLPDDARFSKNDIASLIELVEQKYQEKIHYLEERIRLLLELPFDRRIAEAYAAGQLAVEADHAFCAHMKRLHHAVQLEVEHARACRRQR